ncbi:oxysterol-binding protein-related protein 3-like isoform X2 [Aricia agestis]|uniref:oxysterol-binding protein-related protein 3-like isoform X2 n=1 Tax=Aricia agestis TaxID=91739 RepID=UPI001C208BC4|nr:oxysterol-binding protein-related protein 3-like isoform X2 [Aricia agestis]
MKPLTLLSLSELKWWFAHSRSKREMSAASGLKHVATEPAQLDNKRERRRGNSTRAAGRAAALRRVPSDSDCSVETASLSADSGDRSVRPPPPPVRTSKSRSRRRGSEWEVLEGLKDGQRFDKRPEVFNGYLHKKRKWPLKGWHKRFFVVDGGILVYARSAGDVARGRLHGSVDVGLSVLSAKPRRRRIDIDADEFIYHLRAKTHDAFRTWLHVLKTHRLYRQHLLTFGARESVPKIHAPLDDIPPNENSSRLVSPTSPPLRGPQAGFVSGTPGGRLASWIIESGSGLESATRSLSEAQQGVAALQRLAAALQAAAAPDTDASLDGASPGVKTTRRKFGLRKKKSSTKCSSVDLHAAAHAAGVHLDPSGSHTALSALTAPPSPGGGASSMPNSAASLPIAFLSSYLASTTIVPCAAARPQSLPGAEALNAPTSLTSLNHEHQLRDDFNVLAKDLVTTLKDVVATLVMERGRLRAAMEAGDGPTGGVLTALRNNLSTALHQNEELRARLSRIHDASDLADVTAPPHNAEQNRRFPHSLSYSSSCVSASEFFDAEEHDDNKTDEMLDADEAGVIELDGDSSSEAGSLSSDDASASTDNSDAVARLGAPKKRSTRRRLSTSGNESNRSKRKHSKQKLRRETSTTVNGRAEERVVSAGEEGAEWTRRTRLPHPRPSPAPPSLWNLLYKNIGKDLSQISMPVTINEPLNMLQRLCEELEYSELLDAAAVCTGAAERCALIGAFAVSAYAATAHRAASKPFNPLLGETYECVRADRGFSFLAEQVSHHPPVSACHAESARWVFWQEARIKTKFWGKSMEFQPAGKVHVRLLTTGDHYSWNKVTTCVHNLFGGQRWVDQYGEMTVTCHGTDISCKLNFIKASSWSNSRHEVRGAVSGGGARLRLQGRWTEALHAGEPPAAKCLWRPGAMPAEHELYYGFTRFAMELNELEPGMRDRLPHTDTRLRPDQRALEEGDVESAETLKLQLEQAQRDRRRDRPDHRPQWFRRSGEGEGGEEETWVFSGEYWRARERGFPDLRAPRLW